MSERRGTRALETWCRRLTEGYPGVKVENMTTSWRDGLAFCAIIHHFRPDLIDFTSLNKSDVYYNNSLAFRIGERHLGIPALLDAEDMVEYPVPDRLSILTYLSQFYQVFGTNSSAGGASAAKQGSTARLVPKRSADRGLISPTSTSPPTKMAARSSIGVTGNALARREPCAKCGYPVFLAERLNVGTKLYHRTCFRCARCNNQLSLANCYETETDGQYCCETCPDEEELKPINKFDSVDNLKTDTDIDSKRFDSLDSLKANDAAENLKLTDSLKVVRNRSLSDEEKQKGLLLFEDDNDEYSAHFETTLEDSNEKLYQDDSLFSKARNHFLNAHLLDQKDALVPEINVEPPPLPKSKPPDAPEDPPSLSTTIDPPVAVNMCAAITDETVNNVDLKSIKSEDTLQVDPIVNSTNKVSDNISDQQNTASDAMLEEPTILREKNITKDTNRSSLVKSRMLLFEAQDKPNTSKDKINVVSKYFNNSSNQKSDVDVNDKVPLKEESSKDISVISDSTEEKDIIVEDVIDISDEIIIVEDDIDLSEDIIVIEDVTDELKVEDIPSNDDVESPDSKNETQSNENEESHYQSISSEDILESSLPSSDLHYKTVRSEINISDSLVVDSSNISQEDSPLDDKTNIKKDTILAKILNSSIFDNLSQDQSSISIDPSILDSSASSKDQTEYPGDLNPFGDEPEEDKEETEVRLLIKPSMEDLTILTPDPSTKNSEPVGRKEESTNPFGSSDEDEDKDENVVKSKPPRPPLPSARNEQDGKKILGAPRVSLNPFWSDDEENEQENKEEKPVPMPRSKHLGTPEPKPRRSNLSNCADRYDSNSSLSSMSSSISHTPGRKKKPAPPPPTSQAITGMLFSPHDSKQSSPCTSAQHSPKTTPRTRKNRKAPLPPSSTPLVANTIDFEGINFTPISDLKPDESQLILSPDGEFEKEKIDKDEKNRNRQSQTISSPVCSDSDSLSLSQQGSSSGDKSTHGKWKRKKGPAPARPVPQRRQIRPLPLTELRRELDIIEMQQQGLEKQGVKLEQLIREQCEAPGISHDTALTPEVEELVLELFELVNEKNELFRKQAELMYLRRQQRLEEEHADLEYQIRCLMERPEINKTDSDKAREEELINRLIEVVERRNEIVECLEMDRVREAEEDQSINSHLSMMASKREEELQQAESPVKLSKKEKKKIKKEKKMKDKGKTLDADKDIDEMETKEEKKKKKKWF